MNVWEIVGLVLGSGVMVAVVNLLSDRLKRHDAVTDKKEAAVSQEKSAADQIEELRAETTQQFDNVDRRFAAMEKKIDAMDASTQNIMLSTRAQAYDRIRHLCLTYIRKGEIGANDLDALMNMHEAYQKCGGDGFLDKLMLEVGKLRVVDD